MSRDAGGVASTFYAPVIVVVIILFALLSCEWIIDALCHFTVTRLACVSYSAPVRTSCWELGGAISCMRVSDAPSCAGGITIRVINGFHCIDFADGSQPVAALLRLHTTLANTHAHKVASHWKRACDKHAVTRQETCKKIVMKSAVLRHASATEIVPMKRSGYSGHNPA